MLAGFSLFLDAMMPAFNRVRGSVTCVRLDDDNFGARARGLVYPTSSTDLVDLGIHADPGERAERAKHERRDQDDENNAMITKRRTRWTTRAGEIMMTGTDDSGDAARVNQLDLKTFVGLADVRAQRYPLVGTTRGCILTGSRTRDDRLRKLDVDHGCTRETGHGARARGSWTTSATRSVLDGLAPFFFCFPLLELPHASTGRLRAARSADRRRLCVRSRSLFLSLSLSSTLSRSHRPSVSVTTRTRRCCTNLTRFRWLFVSSSIAETVDDGDRPACPRRNGSPDRREFKGRAFTSLSPSLLSSRSVTKEFPLSLLVDDDAPSRFSSLSLDHNATSKGLSRSVCCAPLSLFLSHPFASQNRGELRRDANSSLFFLFFLLCHR